MEIVHKNETTIFTENLKVKTLNGVLSIQEDSIRLDQSLRGHYHGLILINAKLTISLNHVPREMVKEYKSSLEKIIFLFTNEIFLKQKNVELGMIYYPLKKIFILYGNHFFIMF